MIILNVHNGTFYLAFLIVKKFVLFWRLPLKGSWFWTRATFQLRGLILSWWENMASVLWLTHFSIKKRLQRRSFCYQKIIFLMYESETFSIRSYSLISSQLNARQCQNKGLLCGIVFISLQNICQSQNGMHSQIFIPWIYMQSNDVNDQVPNRSRVWRLKPEVLWTWVLWFMWICKISWMIFFPS